MATLAINELMKQTLTLCKKVMRFAIRFTYFVWTAICVEFDFKGALIIHLEKIQGKIVTWLILCMTIKHSTHPVC